MKFLIRTDSPGDIDVALIEIDADIANDLMLHMNEAAELTDCLEIKFNEKLPISMVNSFSLNERINKATFEGKRLAPYAMHALPTDYEFPPGVMILSNVESTRTVTKDEVRWEIRLPNQSGGSLPGLIKSVMSGFAGSGPAGIFSLGKGGDQDTCRTVGVPKELLKQLVKGAVATADLDLSGDEKKENDD